jgi:Asp-tRNA(Asn)/Glu-tRNA(Gln) amidotransferase A subunit family amidase
MAVAARHPQDLSLRQQAEAVAARDVDPHDLLDATLARLDERNPTLNAVVERFEGESRRMLGEAPDGPLRGVPIGVKDEFALPWRAPRNGAVGNMFGVGASESGVFRRLRDAGAVVVGVTHMHELGLGTTGHLSIYGPCRNPWDPARCAGGSSGGSAAAVAARMVGGAIGADGGGSIRFPSAYCGVTGLKPTWGAVPADGFLHGFVSMAAAGPICRDAGDARLLAEVLMGRRLERRLARGMKVGLPRTQLWGDLDPEVASACDEAVEALRSAGLEVRELSLDGAEHALAATVLQLSLEATPQVKPELTSEIVPRLSVVSRALSKYQLLIPAPALAKAGRARTQLRRSVAGAFDEVDVLAWPSVPASAPLVEDPAVELPSGRYPADYANVRLGGIGNLTGAPAASLPCRRTRDGLPTGLQLLGPWGEEARLLDVADALEEETGREHVDAAPPVPGKAAV